MRRILAVVTALALALAAGAAPARAVIVVERTSDENPVVEISRATAAGALTGLLVGYSISLVDDGNNDDDLIQWGTFLGTMTGLAWGIHNAVSRPQPTALLQLEGGELRTHVLPTIEAGGGVRAHLVGVRF